jgi:hypothetical protein
MDYLELSGFDMYMAPHLMIQNVDLIGYLQTSGPQVNMVFFFMRQLVLLNCLKDLYNNS